MSKLVFFKQNGRFANNLFQYFAAEIIRKKFNYNNVTLDVDGSKYSNEYNLVNDGMFILILKNIKIDTINTEKNFYLDGFFQRSEIFTEYRNYILSIFNLNNTNYFNNLYRICDIFSDVKNENENENSLTLHIRLDDFIHSNYNSEIFDPFQIKELVQKIMNQYKLETLYIVCDKLRQDWEFKYMAHFLDLDPIMINGTLIEDFNFMMKSPYLLTSSSTLSWMAGFLHNREKTIIPYNSFHGGILGTGQHLDKFDENCTVFNDMKYFKI